MTTFFLTVLVGWFSWRKCSVFSVRCYLHQYILRRSLSALIVVPWSGPLVADRASRRPCSVRLRFVVEKVALGQFHLLVRPSLPVTIILPKFHIQFYLHVTLTSINGWNVRNSLSGIHQSCIEKCFHFGLHTHFLHKTVTVRKTSGEALETSNKLCFWRVGELWVGIRCKVIYLLCSFAKCKKRLLASSCLSVCLSVIPPGVIRLQLDGFSLKLVFIDVSKIFRKN
jgi:hypothetical protein